MKTFATIATTLALAMMLGTPAAEAKPYCVGNLGAAIGEQGRSATIAAWKTGEKVPVIGHAYGIATFVGAGIVYGLIGGAITTFVETGAAALTAGQFTKNCERRSTAQSH